MKKNILLYILFVLFLMPTSAYAYLDPGSGSFILQVLVASLVGGGIFFRNFWTRIKNVFKKDNQIPEETEE